MNPKLRLCAVAVALSFLPRATSFAGADAKADPRVAQALNAMFSFHEFEQAAISPDGKRVAWVESLSTANAAPSQNSAIYVADWKSGAAPARISGSTGVGAVENGLAWSPDSKQIAFLSDAGHAGQQQVFVATPSSATRQLTHLKGDLADPKWSPDGKTLAFLFIENAPRAAGPLAAETRDEGVVGDEVYEQRLMLLDLASGKSRAVTPADMYVYEYDWAPDGKQFVATAANGNGDDNWYIASLCIFSAAGGPCKSILKPDMQMGMPKWSPDGSTIALIGGLMSDEPALGGDIYTIPAAGGEARDLTPEMKASASDIEWSANSKSIVFGEIVAGHSGFASVNADSHAITQLWSGAERLGFGNFGVGASFSRDRSIIASVRQSAASPPEVWAGPIGEWKKITTRNREIKPAWGEAKDLRWKTDGGEAQGWLIHPLDCDPGKKYPLVVSVHGGPSSAAFSAWPARRNYQFALPAAGYFLLLPNPRGSYGAGEAYTRANVKDFGYGDFRDIMAGVDEALKSAPIDPDRLGITGWSYGGYMTIWAVTQTHRFRAAVVGAGLSDWLSYYGENKIDKWMTPFFGDTVYNDPAVYARSAPITFIKNVKTPTLLVVGDSDGECPPPQSYEFWHALVTLGVPTQFVIYPHEGHAFTNPAHSRDVAERAIAWFNSHL